MTLQPTYACAVLADKESVYRKVKWYMAGNFGGKIFWRIGENVSFGGITLAASLIHNDIHTKMANRMCWEFDQAVS